MPPCFFLQNTKTPILGQWEIVSWSIGMGSWGQAFLRFLNDRNRNLVICLILHHSMVQDEAKLIFDNANSEPQFLRYASLALADPLGMLLENGENLFVMGNTFSFYDSSANLINLPFSMGNVLLDLLDLQLNNNVRR